MSKSGSRQAGTDGVLVAELLYLAGDMVGVDEQLASALRSWAFEIEGGGSEAASARWRTRGETVGSKAETLH